MPSYANFELLAPTPDDILPLPLPSSNMPINHPEPQAILLQWQRLGMLDPKSHDYVELLKGLVDEEANRHLALGFTGKDAGIVINTIDKVSSSNRRYPTIVYLID